MNPYYSDELVTLYHGDCREVDAWLVADVLITDPPYGMAFVSNMGSSRRPIAGDQDTWARDDALALWGTERPAAVFGTWKVPRPAGVSQVLIWDKTDGSGPGMGHLKEAFGTSHEEIYLLGKWPKPERFTRRGSVIRTTVSPSAYTAKIGHPTPKPVGVMETLVEPSGGVVADPFSGSGSTLIAARNLGRKAIGVELEERYCELIAKRLAQGAFDFGEVS